MDNTKLHHAAVESINALGIDLFRFPNLPENNTLLSPYSIQSALIQAYAGAEGGTKMEMAGVLHYASGGSDIHQSFAALSNLLDATRLKSIAETERQKKFLQRFRGSTRAEDPN